MNNVLIVLDHENRVPPFMITLLLYAEQQYDKVVYVNSREPENHDLFEDTRISILHPSRLVKLGSALLALVRFFSFENLSLWCKCVKDKGFSFGYIKQLLVYLTVDIEVKSIAKKIIKKNNDASITVLAAWFAAAALATAELKKSHKEIKAVSLAHSYEILTIRNAFVPYLYIDKKHRYLDGVYFIARKVREMYVEGVGGLPKEYMEKTHVQYLGSFKNKNVLNKNNPDEFHICTCSRMVALKRLDVLMEALSSWDDGEICWTHIGDGELEKTLKEHAEKVMNSNSKVHIHFTGYMNNELVKQYYEENPIDVFVNLSSTEGLPISIMEAMSYGLPVIATDVGGTSEIVNDEFGILMDSSITPEYIKEQIHSFKNLPVEKRDLMRDNAYRFWSENFDAERNMKLLFDAINNL